jgi:hypothetical protein
VLLLYHKSFLGPLLLVSKITFKLFNLVFQLVVRTCHFVNLIRLLSNLLLQLLFLRNQSFTSARHFQVDFVFQYLQPLFVVTQPLLLFFDFQLGLLSFLRHPMSVLMQPIDFIPLI